MARHKSARAIQVLNPSANHNSHVSKLTARNYVRRGRAEWSDNSHSAIRLLEGFAAAIQASSDGRAILERRQELLNERIKRYGYDHVQRCMMLPELKGIPFAGLRPEAISKLLTGKRIRTEWESA